MPRAYDLRQKKEINYNEKLSNRTKSNPSSARKTRGRKSEGSSIVSNSSSIRHERAINYNYDEDEDDSPESSQVPILKQPEPIRLRSNSSSARRTRGRKSGASSTVSNSRSLRRKKAVNYSYEEDEDDLPESSQTPARLPFVLNSPVFDDQSPPILTREVNNNMEKKEVGSRGWSPPPQLERMSSEDSPPPELEPMEQMASEDLEISNNTGVRPIFEVRPVITLDELLEQRAKSQSAEEFSKEASPSSSKDPRNSYNPEEVLAEATPSPSHSEDPSNSIECEICGNPASKVHYDLHTCESCSVEFFSSYSVDNYNADDFAEATPSPNHPEDPPSSRECQVCDIQANGVHFGVHTCESCSTFFEQKVTELPDYNCYCNRVWKHTFDTNVSCHCCRFQKCLDVGMEIPLDSMFSRITPCSENLGLCRVCRDIGTSHCKGVVTCRSCTFFLFRSTQKPFDGECDKNCLISSSNRNCPACRFNKFRKAESQIPKNDQEDPEQSGPSPSIIQQLSQVFEETCPYTEEKVKMMALREFGWKPNESCSIDTNRRNAWIYFSRLLSKELEPIINFIQSIRSSLTPYDLRALIPRYAFSLLLLWWTSALTTRGLILSNGECIDIKTMGLLYGEELTGKMVRFAEDYKKNSHKEIAVFMRTVFLQTIDGVTKRIEDESFSLRQSLLDESQVYDIEALIPRVNDIDKIYQEEVAVFLKKNEEVFPTGNLFHSVFIKTWPVFVDDEAV